MTVTGLGPISVTLPLFHRLCFLGSSDLRQRSISLALSQDASHNRSRCNVTPRIVGILAHSQSGAVDYLERCFRSNTFAQDQGEPEALVCTPAKCCGHFPAPVNERGPFFPLWDRDYAGSCKWTS